MGQAKSMQRKAKSDGAVASAEALVRFVLEGAFAGKAWQGPTLSGSLRGVTTAQALWCPAPGRKCIWEQTLHATYWKWTIARILAIAAQGVERAEAEFAAFPRSPSNWPATPPRDRCDEAAWKRDRSLLASVHRRLMEHADAIRASRMLERPSPKHQYAIGFYIAGAAAHDAYHTGQVQLIKRLMPANLRPTKRTRGDGDA